MKKGSTSLITRQCKLKPQWKASLHPSRWLFTFYYCGGGTCVTDWVFWSTMWAPGVELKPLDLVESTFTHPTILPTQNHYYFLKYKKKMLTCPYNWDPCTIYRNTNYNSCCNKKVWQMLFKNNIIWFNNFTSRYIN